MGLAVVAGGVNCTGDGDRHIDALDGDVAVGDAEGDVEVLVGVGELFVGQFHIGSTGAGSVGRCFAVEGEVNGFAGNSVQVAVSRGGVAVHGVRCTVVVNGIDSTCDGDGDGQRVDGEFAFGHAECGVNVGIVVGEQVGIESHCIFADGCAGGVGIAAVCHFGSVEQAALAGGGVAGHALCSAVVSLGGGVARHGDSDFSRVDGQLAVGHAECGVNVGIVVGEQVGIESHCIFADGCAGGVGIAAVCHFGSVEQAALAGGGVAGHALCSAVVSLGGGVARHGDSDFSRGDGQLACYIMNIVVVGSIGNIGIARHDFVRILANVGLCARKGDAGQAIVAHQTFNSNEVVEVVEVCVGRTL